MTVKPSCIFGALILLCMLCIVPVLADTWENNWAPWVTKTTTTNATINWRQDTNGTGTVAYARTEFYNQNHRFDSLVSDTSATPYHHILLTGLAPDTSYTYLVQPVGNPGVFSPRVFRTMPVSGPFTFIVISDPQEGHNYTEEQRFRYVADAVAREPDVLFILDGGDYAGHDSLSLWSKHFQVADGMLANAAIFPTIGNHEYHNASGGDNPPAAADQFHRSYDMPLNYSFDCAGVRFIVLDTPDPKNADGDDPHTSLALAMSQESWLREQLGNTPSGTFTIHHHPVWDYYNSTSNPNLQPWETLYHTYNISANFAGHTHNYQRYSVMGIPYFIVGNAGGRFADLTSDNPYPAGYQFGDTRQLGYLKVFVDPANKTATAQEIFVASVKEDDSNETPEVHNPPVVADSITFPLKRPASLPGMNPTGTPPAGKPAGSSPGMPVAVIIIVMALGIGTVIIRRRDSR